MCVVAAAAAAWCVVLLLLHGCVLVLLVLVMMVPECYRPSYFCLQDRGLPAHPSGCLLVYFALACYCLLV